MCCSRLHQSLSKWRDLHSSWHLHLWCGVDRNAVWNRWVKGWCLFGQICTLCRSSIAFNHYSNVICSLSIPAVDCGDPGTPTNGQRSLSSTTYNSVVTYTCDAGYTLQGSNSRTCQSNGQWSGSVPQCNRELVCLLHLIMKWCYYVNVCRLPITATCTSPCQNGGSCTSPDTCTCVAGWAGMYCETSKAVICNVCWCMCI